MNDSFFPSGPTTNAVFTTTGTVKATVGGAGDALRIVNVGTTTAFLTLENTGTITAATATSMPIVNGHAPEIFAINPTGTIYATGIVASGSTTVYFTRGDKA